MASERDGWWKTLTYTGAEVAALSHAGCDADTPSHMHALWLLFARECCELEVAFETAWVVVLGVLGKRGQGPSLTFLGVMDYRVTPNTNGSSLLPWVTEVVAGLGIVA